MKTHKCVCPKCQLTVHLSCFVVVDKKEMSAHNCNYIPPYNAICTPRTYLRRRATTCTARVVGGTPTSLGTGWEGESCFVFFKAHSCLSTIKAVTYIASAFASIPDLLLLLLRLNFCFWQVVFFSPVNHLTVRPLSYYYVLIC